MLKLPQANIANATTQNDTDIWLPNILSVTGSQFCPATATAVAMASMETRRKIGFLFTVAFTVVVHCRICSDSHFIDQSLHVARNGSLKF